MLVGDGLVGAYVIRPPELYLFRLDKELSLSCSSLTKGRLKRELRDQ